MMQRILVVTFFVLLFAGSPVGAKDKALIMVSIPPLQYMMQRIVGDEFGVDSLVAVNGSPEVFEPSPKQLLKIQSADLYFSLSLNFEQKWLPVVQQQSSIYVVEDCCADLKTLDITEHGHALHHHQDPHIWTDPFLSIEVARRMKDSVSRLYGDKAQVFQQNFQALEQELLALDAVIRLETEKLSARTFVVSHPAWGYFARRYGLQQLSIEQEGKNTGARSRAILIKLARQKHITTVFHQSQLNNKGASLLAKEINAELIELNPLGYEHIANIQYTANAIIKSLQAIE